MVIIGGQGRWKTYGCATPLAIGERYRRLVASLEAELSRDVHKARAALRQIVGNEIPVVPHESGEHLVARLGLETEALLAAGGSEIFVVAGAGYLLIYQTCA